MKDENQNITKIKVAISLNKLLNKSKSNSVVQSHEEYLGDSYNKIASIVDVRKATVSDIFNARTSANSFTLFGIINAMGFKIKDFATFFDEIEDKEILDFKSNFKN